MASPVATFVIFDLEGTGLPSQPADQPVRIIEISMVAVQRPESAVPVSPPPGPRRASSAATAQESPLHHLPPGQRGCVTPKRPIRDSGEPLTSAPLEVTSYITNEISGGGGEGTPPLRKCPNSPISMIVVIFKKYLCWLCSFLAGPDGCRVRMPWTVV